MPNQTCQNCKAISADCAHGDLQGTCSCLDALARLKGKTVLYRQHRGGLFESLGTTIPVTSLQDVLDHENNQLDGLGIQLTLNDLTCAFYCHDDRMPDWHDTHIITATNHGVLGFSNGELH